MLAIVAKILYVVSASVLVPVILALLAQAGWTVLLMGGILREWFARVAMHRWLGSDLNRPLCTPELRATVERLARQADAAPSIGFLPRYLRTCWQAEPDPVLAEKMVDEIEIEMARRVATLSTIARLGPMLGLTGTLIPLGPGLVNLARGDVAGLASQLVIAFSTTIVGLLIGMLAFVGAQVRRSWYAKDLSDVLFLEEIRCTKEPATL